MDPSLRALIEQAEFKESFRGYDRAQVDDTLEQLATRAGKLEKDLTEATSRLETAETRIRAELDTSKAGGATQVRNEQEDAEEVRLTLVMAQRTADAAIAEARVKADELLDAARTDALRATADARSESTRERREGRQRLETEVKDLEEIRAMLQGDVEALERHVDAEREQLTNAVDRLRQLLDDPAGFRTTPPPTPTPVTMPEPPQEPEASEEEAVTASAPDSVAPEEDGAAGTEAANGQGAPSNHDATVTVPSVDAAHEEDAFLNELRKAMNDDEPLNPSVRPGGQLAEGAQRKPTAQGSSAVDQTKQRFGRRR